MSNLSKKDYNAYMREYKNARYHRRRTEAIDFLGGKCAQCGSVESLEFDHISPKEKSFHMHLLRDVSKERFWKEVKKCQLLCDPCHNQKTLKQKRLSTARGTHGTLSSYRYCKCQKCREAKSSWMKIYKQNRRDS